MRGDTAMKEKKSRRDKVVMVRLSDEEHDEIQKRANELGTTASGYLRMLLRRPEIGEPFSTGEGQNKKGKR
jgi:predicted DNA binding CopG/RHH family protein